MINCEAKGDYSFIYTTGPRARCLQRLATGAYWSLEGHLFLAQLRRRPIWQRASYPHPTRRDVARDAWIHLLSSEEIRGRLA